MTPELEKLIREIPKAENHCHFDSISADLAWKFMQRNDLDMPYASLEDVKALYQYSTLPEFLNVYLTAVATIMTVDDFADVVMEYADDMKRQNIVYRELMFDYPACFGSRGIPFSVMAEGLEKGLAKAKEKYGDIDIRLIANLDRMAPVETNLEFLKEMVDYLDRLPIIAVGLDNAEDGFPAHNQAEAFAFAKENGLYLTAHSGEDCGPESVIDALDSLHLDRVDHGIRSIEDPELMKRLADEKMLCTLCPDSNVTLGSCPEWENYPLRAFMDAGVPVSISSDDPPYFKLDLTGNLIRLAELFDLTEDEVIVLVRNALEYNFAGKEHLQEIDEYLAATYV